MWKKQHKFLLHATFSTRAIVVAVVVTSQPTCATAGATSAIFIAFYVFLMLLLLY